MLRPCLAAAALLVSPSLAHASADVEVLGWADGGTSFVYKLELSNADGPSTCTESQTSIFVVDTKTLKKTEFPLERVDECSTPEVRTTDEELEANEEAFAAWEEAHPLKPSKASRTSPDGRQRAEVVLQGNKSGAWKGETFTYSGFQETPAGGEEAVSERPYQNGAALLSVKGPQGVRPSAVGSWGCVGGSIHAYWSPASDAVAWALKNETTFACDASVDVQVARLAAPTIELLTPRSLSYQATERVMAALAALGHAPARQNPPRKERAVSVVYFAPASEAVAKAIAAKLPGGATTEPLSWKADCDVVVALGASAAK